MSVIWQGLFLDFRDTAGHKSVQEKKKAPHPHKNHILLGKQKKLQINNSIL